MKMIDSLPSTFRLALNKIIFCGWLARLLSDHIEYLDGTFVEKDITESVVRSRDTDIVRHVLDNHWLYVVANASISYCGSLDGIFGRIL